MVRIRGGYRVPRPLTLEQLSGRLVCELADAAALLADGAFPHAFRDCDEQWRIPWSDVDAYVRHINGHRSYSNGNGNGHGNGKPPQRST